MPFHQPAGGRTRVCKAHRVGSPRINLDRDAIGCVVHHLACSGKHRRVSIRRRDPIRGTGQRLPDRFDHQRCEDLRPGALSNLRRAAGRKPGRRRRRVHLRSKRWPASLTGVGLQFAPTPAGLWQYAEVIPTLNGADQVVTLPANQSAQFSACGSTRTSYGRHVNSQPHINLVSPRGR
jgi:hypothetical protein